AWLSAFATSDGSSGGKGPKEFSSVSWGKIGNIGGEQVIPKALETISITSGTWETILISWRTGGSTSDVWIVDDFPFPVKASTLTHVSEGIPPPEYKFELLDYKENILQSPFDGIIPTEDEFLAIGCDTNIEKKTSIKKPTYNYHYQVYVFYGPADPVQGCELELTIKFISKFDDTAFLNQVQYDFLVVDDNLTPLRSIAQEEGQNFLYSPSGLASLDFVVKEEPGNINYVIWIYGMAPPGLVPNPLETPSDYLEITIPIFANENMIIDTPPVETTPEVQPTTEIQSWIKTSVGYWADGVSSDAEFIASIQFLIKEGIIQIPQTTQGTGETTEIQSWIKTSVGYWADGVSSDAEFIASIQFLIKEGIISIS
ncbi:peptidase, partial [Nitrosarchaeum koreense]|nr:peptidase [Nitrosarchaeum koreense]